MFMFSINSLPTMNQTRASHNTNNIEKSANYIDLTIDDECDVSSKRLQANRPVQKDIKQIDQLEKTSKTKTITGPTQYVVNISDQRLVQQLAGATCIKDRWTKLTFLRGQDGLLVVDSVLSHKVITKTIRSCLMFQASKLGIRKISYHVQKKHQD